MAVRMIEVIPENSLKSRGRWMTMRIICVYHWQLDGIKDSKGST